MGKRILTSINIDKKLHEDIRASGVKNFSKYVENLAKADIYNVSKLGGDEQKKLAKLEEELKYWENEWEQYLKKHKVKA
ncbi:hypothetical protein CCP3SC15_1440007 [Gammaproteobacteria bacterium]